MKNLNLEFEKYTKKQWLDVIAKSLKKGSIDEFVWALNDEIKGEPFAHIDDIPDKISPINSRRKDNNWNIGLDYSLVDSKDHNSYMKHHLKFGLESIIINIPRSKTNFDKLLKGVNLEDLEVIFNTRYGVDLVMFLENFKDCLLFHHYDIKKLDITLRLPVNRPMLIHELYNYSKINFSSLNFYLKTDRLFSYDPVQQLLQTFNAITEFVEKSEIKKDMLKWLLGRLKVHLFMSGNFLSDIATLRAFKIIWNNYIKAFRLKDIEPQIIIGVNHDSFTDDENNDLIIATLVSMAGAIAGVNSINLAVRNEGINNEENSMRLMLNIQNIMKLESNMGIVKDALAGSYAIENATIRIAESVWEKM